MILIGVHLPVLLPIANLGVIVIDEEHEVGYQEKKHPKINSKEAAILRAQCAGIPILLGFGNSLNQLIAQCQNKKMGIFSTQKKICRNATHRESSIADRK